MTESKAYVVRTPLFPLHSEVAALVRVLDGVPRSAVRALIKALWDQTGTPQNPVDWSEPDTWIGDRLAGESQQLAKRIWEGSQRQVNPRHMYGAYLYLNSYGLLQADATGIYRLSADGKGFLNNDPAIVRRLDEEEGLPRLLSILSVHSPAKRGDLLGDWGDFLLAHSKFGTLATIKDTLSRRINNLVERGYISRDGNTYTITDAGLAYASSSPEKQVSADPQHSVLTAIKSYNDVQVAALRERLESMDPYLFEVLIKDLLEAMDYEDVMVTKQSGDKGVDVVATYQFGITQIREVVQVKRHKGNITRPVLDQLRGALPYHQAIRGTIITIGGFAKGCTDAALYPGAAPITLIDGNRLIELLVKHEVAVKKRQQTLVEIDESYFSEGKSDAELPEGE